MAHFARLTWKARVVNASKRQELAAIRVLVVDDEVNLRFAIERGLRKAGHVADSASTIRQGIERLRAQAYDVVVCDLRMPGGDGNQLVQWLGSFSPSTRIIVVSAFVTPEFRAQYEGAQGLRIVEKPVELNDLISMIEAIGPRRGFFGNSIEVELFDYVQMIAISGRDKWIEVTTPVGIGQVWFEHGDIVHAEFDGQKGETAFYRLLAAGRGSFKEVFYRAPPEQSIVGSATHLLMEAARLMDEGTLEQAAGIPAEVDDETSFAGLGEEDDAGEPSASGTMEIDRDQLLPADSNVNDDDGADDMLLVDDDDEAGSAAPPPPATKRAVPPPPPIGGKVKIEANAAPPKTASPPAAAPRPAAPPSASQSMSQASLLEDPEMRELMLGQFFEFEGVDGAAIISSTGKVLAEDMRGNSSLVTLAGFYMRGAARIARSLGNNVFDGIVARSTTGQQLVMVSMGATSAVLSVEHGVDPEEVRDDVMGLEG
jgi:CheY-like chemotaxis protein